MCIRDRLGVTVLITYSPQNGVILLVMAFLISPMGLPLAEDVYKRQPKASGST